MHSEKKLLNSFIRIALILGDSVLANLFTVDEDLKKKFQNDFEYDHVYNEFIGGADFTSIARKCFPRNMAYISRNHEFYTVDVFVFAGAVDLSDALVGSAFDEGIFLQQRFSNSKIIMDDPLVRKLYLFPLTPRKVCKTNLRERFPHYGDKNWIDTANSHIRSLNQVITLQHHVKLINVPCLPFAF